jgi:hemoglobin
MFHRSHHSCPFSRPASLARFALVCLIIPLAFTGCGAEQKQQPPFHTSGNREADQRAEQRIAKDQQLKGQGANSESGNSSQVEKQPLYVRLGGEEGLTRIVDDFTKRALADPRVNWERKGISKGGVLGIGASSAYWNPSPENVQQLKKHLVQFLSLATGGPAHYDGREMTEAHKGLQISNAEFDAAVGDLKATLDKFVVPTDEQKELLAIIESTRTQVVEKR